MKAIHNLAAGLLLLLSILNIYLAIITKPDPSYSMYLVFGIVYFVLALLLYSNIRFSEFLGFIIPLAILFIYPALIGFKNLNPWSSGIMGAIDAIVVICCLIMLLLKL
jgi:hypothetical protein